ncbi:hypothetical protein ROZALSC1DRAFT_29489 [Rozella allomycis CSF55]|uniref:Uncharacterized protein n=1 Tax=Rozella allomycis (strain CSF55) TaxID=988480 RepID=A0A075AYL9_ROZAC|nr:hypothetical protein O9G_000389 [Rozella allomycis CSF55]RKP18854.1 hypothetical protein ROZALSC1DRAFT_29489 [Rozella allomycis CSF55]|eukprot:EPZ33614.1 hypothetical protein O9G_000389 [Rozella allomycis CSF55]
MSSSTLPFLAGIIASGISLNIILSIKKYYRDHSEDVKHQRHKLTALATLTLLLYSSTSINLCLHPDEIPTNRTAAGIAINTFIPQIYISGDECNTATVLFMIVMGSRDVYNAPILPARFSMPYSLSTIVPVLLAIFVNGVLFSYTIITHMRQIATTNKSTYKKLVTTVNILNVLTLLFWAEIIVVSLIYGGTPLMTPLVVCSQNAILLVLTLGDLYTKNVSRKSKKGSSSNFRSKTEGITGSTTLNKMKSDISVLK